LLVRRPTEKTINDIDEDIERRRPHARAQSDTHELASIEVPIAGWIARISEPVLLAYFMRPTAMGKRH
jgi:hypothetical protein